MVSLYSRHIPEHGTFGIFQKFLLEVGERETFRSCFYRYTALLMMQLAVSYLLLTVVCNRPSDEMNNYFTLYCFIREIMNIIAINGHEISLGGLVNLHEKTVYTYNGIFAKINNYYDFISYRHLKIMHFNDVRLLFYSFSHF